MTKTNDRRVLELSANAVKWLKLWLKGIPELRACRTALVGSADEGGLRKAAGLRPWPHDVLRHCFASYFHATHGDKTRLQNQMGHSESEDTLDRHYRAVQIARGKALTEKEAAAFWRIAPDSVARKKFVRSPRDEQPTGNGE